jgi:hypothetical protein
MALALTGYAQVAILLIVRMALQSLACLLRGLLAPTGGAENTVRTTFLQKSKSLNTHIRIFTY